MKVQVAMVNLLHFGRCGSSERLHCNCKERAGRQKAWEVMEPFMEGGDMREGASWEEDRRCSDYEEFSIERHHLTKRFEYKTSFLRLNLIFNLFYRETTF